MSRRGVSLAPLILLLPAIFASSCTANPQVAIVPLAVPLVLANVESPSHEFLGNFGAINLAAGSKLFLLLTIKYSSTGDGPTASCARVESFPISPSSSGSWGIADVPIGTDQCPCQKDKCQGTVTLQLEDSQGTVLTGPETNVVVSWKASGRVEDMKVSGNPN